MTVGVPYTLIYCLFSIILLVGVFRKTSYLEALLGKALPLSYDGWMILTRRMAYFFLFLAALNEFVSGLKDGLPLQIGVIPFGIVFGIVGLEVHRASS